MIQIKECLCLDELKLFRQVERIREDRVVKEEFLARVEGNMGDGFHREDEVQEVLAMMKIIRGLIMVKGMMMVRVVSPGSHRSKWARVVVRGRGYVSSDGRIQTIQASSSGERAIRDLRRRGIQ